MLARRRSSLSLGPSASSLLGRGHRVRLRSEDYLRLLTQMAAEHVKLLQNKECDWTVASVVFKHAEEDDTQWLSVITALTSLKSGLYSDVFINCFIHYWLPVPPVSEELLGALTDHLCNCLENDKVDHVQLNAGVMFRALAQKYVGRISERLLTDRALSCLLCCLEAHQRPTVRCQAIVALQAFARSTVNKKRIMSTEVRGLLWECVQSADSFFGARSLPPNSAKTGANVDTCVNAGASNDRLGVTSRSRALSEPGVLIGSERPWSYGGNNARTGGNLVCGAVESVPNMERGTVGDGLGGQSRDSGRRKVNGLRSFVQRLARFYGPAPADQVDGRQADTCLSCHDDGTCDEGTMQRQMDQLRFCATWSLNNTFFRDDMWQTPPISLTGINATLDPSEVGRHLSVSEDALQVRNDTNEFESVRANVGVSSGRWYYEATVYGPFCFQIGWTTATVTKYGNGDGVGDDEDSVGFDPVRQLLWVSRGGNKNIVARCNSPFRPGDTIGFRIDLQLQPAPVSPNGLYTFLHNNKVVVSVSTNRPITSNTRHYPAASFNFQHVRFNFGSTPFVYPQPPYYRPIGEAPGVPSIPKPMPSERSRYMEGVLHGFPIEPSHGDTSLVEEGNKECQICYDGECNVRLLPCHHSDLCLPCATQCTQCPLCRATITARLVNGPLEPQHKGIRAC